VAWDHLEGVRISHPRPNYKRKDKKHDFYFL
jgi:hypothetical protein